MWDESVSPHQLMSVGKLMATDPGTGQWVGVYKFTAPMNTCTYVVVVKALRCNADGTQSVISQDSKTITVISPPPPSSAKTLTLSKRGRETGIYRGPKSSITNFASLVALDFPCGPSRGDRPRPERVARGGRQPQAAEGRISRRPGPVPGGLLERQGIGVDPE